MQNILLLKIKKKRKLINDAKDQQINIKDCVFKEGALC